MDTLLAAILSNTYTTSDLYHRYALLREFTERVTYTRQGWEDEPLLDSLARFLEERGEDERERRSLVAWGEEIWQALVSGDSAQKLTTLHERLEELPVVVLYVPVDLPPAQTDDIGAFIREATGEEVVLDTRISPSAAGGCMFSWRGTLYRYSLGARLVRHHHEIVRMLREYGDSKMNPPAQPKPHFKRAPS